MHQRVRAQMSCGAQTPDQEAEDARANHPAERKIRPHEKKAFPGTDRRKCRPRQAGLPVVHAAPRRAFRARH